MRTPFMQLYVSDFLGDTLHLSTEQLGSYMLLLMAMWNADGKLQNDDNKLARISRLSLKKWNAIKDDVLVFFTETGAVISNNRMTEELQKVRGKSEKRSDAGRRGGISKSLKDKEAHLANAMPLPWHLPDTITIKKKNISSLRSDIQKPETKKPSKSKSGNGSRLSENWTLSDEDHEKSIEIGLSEQQIRIEEQKFRDHWLAKSGKDATKRDWSATWRNWCRNALQWQASRPITQQKQKSKYDILREYANGGSTHENKRPDDNFRDVTPRRTDCADPGIDVLSDRKNGENQLENVYFYPGKRSDRGAEAAINCPGQSDQYGYAANSYG